MKNEFIKMEPLKVGVGNAVKEERPGRGWPRPSVCENERRVAKRQIPRGGIREDGKK